MTEYIDKTISILEDATKHLSDGNNMLCAMAIGRAIATLDAQKNRTASATSVSQLIYTEDPVPTRSVQYDTTNKVGYTYTPSVTCGPASNNPANSTVVKDAQSPLAYPSAVQAQELVHAVELPTTPKCDKEDEGDLSNITVEDIKEFSKMKKLMASMEIIDAMKSRVSGLCSKISESVKDRLQNRRTLSYKPFYYMFIIQKL